MTRALALLVCLWSLPAAAIAAPPRVVADIPPVAALADTVLGDLGRAEVLLPPGASPHDLALKPSDASALEAADLIVWIGPELTPNLARPLETLAPGAARLTLAELPATRHLPARTETLFAPAPHAHDHDHAHSHDHGGHDHAGSDDPHLWLDPENAALWLKALAEALAAADPDNAATYHANAEAGRAAIAAATENARATLAGADRPLAVLHDAFQYFEVAFGLQVLGALSPSDATSPSPRRLAALRDALPADTCLLAEPQYDPRLVAALGPDIAAAELDPTGMGLPGGAAFYPALLADLAGRIADCGATG